MIQTYITDENLDIICFSKFFCTNDDHKLKIDGYNLLRSDHPRGLKKVESVFIKKKNIPLIRRDDICTLGNCVVIEIR